MIYDVDYLDIGFGVTISGPHLVGRMTSSIDVKMGEKVLEIGTGSGYQSAYLSNLTDKVWTIEIIKPLAERTRGVYDALIERGYTEYKAIKSKNADGYYGWEEAAPFDKIIVTCGIDHIPPPLLQQLKPDGIMVIPVGPAGRAARPQGRQGGSGAAARSTSRAPISTTAGSCRSCRSPSSTVTPSRGRIRLRARAASWRDSHLSAKFTPSSRERPDQGRPSKRAESCFYLTTPQAIRSPALPVGSVV